MSDVEVVLRSESLRCVSRHWWLFNCVFLVTAISRCNQSKRGLISSDFSAVTRTGKTANQQSMRTDSLAIRHLMTLKSSTRHCKARTQCDNLSIIQIYYRFVLDILIIKTLRDPNEEMTSS